jgi:hypothetical protein
MFIHDDKLFYTGDTEKPAIKLAKHDVSNVHPLIENSRTTESLAETRHNNDDDEIRITYETYKQNRLYTNFETNQIKEIKHLIEKIIHPNIYGGSSERQKRIKARTESMKLSTSASLNLKSTATLQTKKHHHSRDKLPTAINGQVLKLPVISENKNVEKNDTPKNKTHTSDELFSTGTILRTIDRLNISSDSGQLRKISPKNKYDPYELSKLSQQSSNGNEVLFSRANLQNEFFQYDEKYGSFLKTKRRKESPSYVSNDFNLPNISEYLNKTKPIGPIAATHGNSDETKSMLSRSNSFIIYDTSHKLNGANVPKVNEATSKINTRNNYDRRNHQNNVDQSKLNRNFRSELDINNQVTTDNSLEIRKDQPTSKVSKHSGKLYVDIYIPSF